MQKSEIKAFKFKQFEVAHSQSTLKVGTDAVLLGIYSSHPSPHTILDIGTGTGVIALLLAQRFSDAQIVGIDIDSDSIQEASYNFSQSPWAKRLEARQIDFDSFTQASGYKFDFIVSNPPFFENDLPPIDSGLKKAKHAYSLTSKTLIQNIAILLADKGSFSLILPYDRADYFITLAGSKQLYCTKQLVIFPKEDKAANRCILEFHRHPSIRQVEQLIIYNKDNSYTKQYRNLGKEYYLNF